MNNKFENYEKFLNVVDDDLKKIFQYQSEYIECKRGCSLCCKQGDYPLSSIEFDYLMSGFNLLDEDIKNLIRQNIEELKKCDKNSYICPFLINDCCSVYNYRPFVCRAFGVLTEDSKGRPSFPFCTTKGLNFSKIYDEEKKHLSSDLVKKNNFKIFPKIFRLSNNVIMKLPLAKELNIEFGEAKRLVDFLIQD